jgi:hypothetical protein
MTDSDERPETWRPVAPMDGCTFSGYEVSDKCSFRSVDRTIGGRSYKGQPLRTSPHEDGYRLIKLRCDDLSPGHKAKRVHGFHAPAVMLTTFDRPRPAGMEVCHSSQGPAFNWWPEGVRWGTKPENHADQVAAGTAVVPEAFECVTPGCGGKTKNPGRRCRERCVPQVGQLAAQLLNAGMPSMEVAERFGYTGDRWVFDLAVQHGGYAGERAAARTQRPSMIQRVQILGILRLARRSGQLRGDAS